MKDNICPKCRRHVTASDKFCQSCGFQLNPSEPSKQTSTNGPKTFVSKGSYSGKMLKGKTSRGWKIFRNIVIAIIVIGIIAIVIWYKTDPDAGEKLGNILFGAVVMLIFGFVIWRKSKKGKMKSSKKREANYDYDDIDNQVDDIDNSEDD